MYSMASTKIFGIGVLVSEHDCDKQPRFSLVMTMSIVEREPSGFTFRITVISNL